MRRIKHMGLEKRNRRTGRMYVLLWEIGFVLFVLLPLVESVVYSFSEVQMSSQGGFNMTPVGLKNYRFIFFESPMYVDNLFSSLSSFFTSVPIIFALSLILGVVLNQKFRGRLFFRALFFVPVIISTGIVLDTVMGGAGANQMLTLGGNSGSYYSESSINLNEFMGKMGIPASISNLLLGYVQDIVTLIWDCSVPIVIFVAGLQSISESVYEAATVEGVNAWERFWYITFPMLANTSVLVLVYTSVSFFVKQNNPVIRQAFIVILEQQVYSVGSAMLLAYFVIIIALSALVFIPIYFLWLRRLK